jgi:hypothetical protein
VVVSPDWPRSLKLPREPSTIVLGRGSCWAPPLAAGLLRLPRRHLGRRAARPRASAAGRSARPPSSTATCNRAARFWQPTANFIWIGLRVRPPLPSLSSPPPVRPSFASTVRPPCNACASAASRPARPCSPRWPRSYRRRPPFSRSGPGSSSPRAASLQTRSTPSRSRASQLRRTGSKVRARRSRRD